MWQKKKFSIFENFRKIFPKFLIKNFWKKFSDFSKIAWRFFRRPSPPSKFRIDFFLKKSMVGSEKANVLPIRPTFLENPRDFTKNPSLFKPFRPPGVFFRRLRISPTTMRDTAPQELFFRPRQKKGG